MAPSENSGIGRKERLLFHNKKALLKIDMTPIVDLGFLLITFFVFTTTMSTPKATDLFMPKDGDPIDLPKSLALTLLLDNDDKIFYYHGDFSDAVKANAVFETNYSTYEGIGKVIRQKQKDIDASRQFAEGRRGLMVLIKPTSKSDYRNLVDALDEAVINDVRKYAIVDPTTKELASIKTKINSGK